MRRSSTPQQRVHVSVTSTDDDAPPQRYHNPMQAMRGGARRRSKTIDAADDDDGAKPAAYVNPMRALREDKVRRKTRGEVKAEEKAHNRSSFTIRVSKESTVDRVDNVDDMSRHVDSRRVDSTESSRLETRAVQRRLFVHHLHRIPIFVFSPPRVRRSEWRASFVDVNSVEPSAQLGIPTIPSLWHPNLNLTLNRKFSTQ
jgi:hypothetical protein